MTKAKKEWWVFFDFTGRDGIPMQFKIIYDQEEAERFADENNGRIQEVVRCVHPFEEIEEEKEVDEDDA